MRHTWNEHLNQSGVNLARRVGDTVGKFDLVITSRLPRAFETAIAMGYAVDEQNDILNQGGVLDAEIPWNAGFAAFAQAFQENETVAKFARTQAIYWRAVAEALPEDGRALLITHGGFIEAGTVACLSAEKTKTLGDFCKYCEGVTLSYDAGEFTNIVVLRVEQ
jgi:broad specificity phosphatase PhoE